MTIYNPAHPGAILREDLLKPLDVSITAAAAALGISRKTLSKIPNERGAITAEMAMRLKLAFGKPKAEQWLALASSLRPLPGRYAQITAGACSPGPRRMMGRNNMISVSMSDGKTTK